MCDATREEVGGHRCPFPGQSGYTDEDALPIAVGCWVELVLAGFRCCRAVFGSLVCWPFTEAIEAPGSPRGPRPLLRPGTPDTVALPGDRHAEVTQM